MTFTARSVVSLTLDSGRVIYVCPADNGQKTVFRVDALRIQVNLDSDKKKYFIAVEDGQENLDQLAKRMFSTLSVIAADIDLADKVSKSDCISMNGFNGAYMYGKFVSVSNGALFLGEGWIIQGNMK